jgi:hypothetical protein
MFRVLKHNRHLPREVIRSRSAQKSTEKDNNISINQSLNQHQRQNGTRRLTTYAACIKRWHAGGAQQRIVVVVVVVARRRRRRTLTVSNIVNREPNQSVNRYWSERRMRFNRCNIVVRRARSRLPIHRLCR